MEGISIDTEDRKLFARNENTKEDVSPEVVVPSDLSVDTNLTTEEIYQVPLQIMLNGLACNNGVALATSSSDPRQKSPGGAKESNWTGHVTAEESTVSPIESLSSSSCSSDLQSTDASMSLTPQRGSYSEIMDLCERNGNGCSDAEKTRNPLSEAGGNTNVSPEHSSSLMCACCKMAVGANSAVEIKVNHTPVSVKKALATVFHFPYENNGQLRGNLFEETCTLCDRCESALTTLYSAFTQFTSMLHAEGQIMTSLTAERGSEECKLAFESTRRSTTNATGSNRIKKKPVVVEDFPKRKVRSSKGSTSENDLTSHAGNLTNLVADFRDSDGKWDDAVSEREWRGCHKTKSRRKMGTKSKPPKRKKSSETNLEGEPFEANDEPNRGKRSRSWKKEYWIEKAQSDPLRTCDLCGKSFIFPAVMKRHKRIVHQGLKPYECASCGKSFTQKVILNKHKCDFSKETGNRDLLQLTREEQLRKFACNVCGKRFKYPTHLALHEMNHRDERPFLCTQCGKSFRRPDHLKYHVRIVHVDEKKFVCTKCGQTFKSISSLRAHEKKHMSDQGHLCNICGKSIKSMYQMSRHQKTHQDELPFVCPVCGKRFKMKDYLGQHLRRGKSCAKKPAIKTDTAVESSSSEPSQEEELPSFSNSNNVALVTEISDVNSAPNTYAVSRINEIFVSSVEFACFTTPVIVDERLLTQL